MSQLSSATATVTPPADKVRFLYNDPVFHQFLPNAPLMCVVNPERSYDEIKKRNVIIGIRCYWFNDKNERCSDLFESNVLRHPTPKECMQFKLKYKPEWNTAHLDAA